MGKKVFKKKLLASGLVLLLGTGTLFSAPAVFAESVEDLENRQNEIQEERTEIKSDLSEAEEELAEVLNEMEDLNEQIKRVEEAITDNQELIAETKAEINAAEEEVAELEENIEELVEEIEARNELLKERASAYQKNGTSIDYLEVILGSQDFGDFLERVMSLSQIAKADADFLERHHELKTELAEKQESVEGKLADLQEMMTELKGMEHHLLDQQNQIDELIKELEKKERQTEQLMQKLIDRDGELAGLEADIKAEIEQERERIRQERELERQRQLEREREEEEQRQAEEAAAAEAAQAAQAAASSNSNSGSDSSSSSSSQSQSSSESSNSSNSSSNSNSGTSSESVTTKTSSSSTSSGSSSSSSGSGSDKINTVINAGNRYIGNSVYVFGGGRTDYDVRNGRFDCSGFTRWAFSQAGISLGASTDQQKNQGRRVSFSEAKPGDLVFFNTYKTDGHVGIYLGGNKFIGSQSSTGVAVADMSSGYWAETFNGRVMRIIE
ncbi:NlpC/P60 family protein [Evansella sp. LMS18]|uniref:C40 family peptidase n=1 Tax=Evansella sp. LMS18 TaxID=2924033 RepID=UPI0020D13E1F|nr:C40 family peptidase [Evansella sp. LMS18]UTR11692.1 NlpC/P60 family protein [Evansella sp. LMS18]